MIALFATIAVVPLARVAVVGTRGRDGVVRDRDRDDPVGGRRARSASRMVATFAS